MKIYIKSLRKAKREKLPQPPVPEFVGECILKIANKLANRPNFMNYPFREEMISDGIEKCIKYAHNYDIGYDNPFAYFTQIIYYAFLNRIDNEKTHLYTKYRYVDEFVLNQAHESEVPQIQQYISEYSDDLMRDFMNTFEEKKEEKRKTNKKKAIAAKRKKTRQKNLELIMK
jgi:DNA-directed RNA polymerase specialized sigma24 family protein